MKTLSLISISAILLAAPMFADSIVFNSPANTNLGATHDFTFGTAVIHAAAFNGGSLFSKSGGAGEEGLGLTGDPSGDNEIWVKSKGTQDFIQLDLLDLINKGYTSFAFSMNSSTGGEGWTVSACSVSGTDCGASAVTGTNESSHAAPANLNATNHYLDFMATGAAGSNVLLHGLTATAPVPEPTSFLLLGTALAIAGKVLKSRTRS
jgi:hypothetical protein